MTRPWSGSSRWDTSVTERPVRSTQRGAAAIRFAALLVVAATVALGGLAFFNSSRIDGRRFDEMADSVIARAERIRDLAGPDYETTALSSLPENGFNGEFYRLDDMLGEAEATGNTDNPSAEHAAGFVTALEFNDPTAPGLATAAVLDDVRIADGALEVTHRDNGYLSNIDPLGLPKGEIAEIMMRVRVSKGRQVWLGWHNEREADTPFHTRVTIDLVADGEFHTYVVDAENALKRGTKDAFNRGVKAKEVLDWISVRPSDVAGDEVEIDYIRFISKLARYQREPQGVTYERVAEEERRVLYVLPPRSLSYRLRVPDDAPRLVLGASMLPVDVEPSRRAELRVTVRTEEGTTELLRERISDPSRWRDASFDLTRWAGRDVELELSASGDPSTVVLWSNPTIHSERRKPMNVILILEDTMRADHLSVYGYDQPTTPFKEELARRAVVFDNAFTQATKTRPSVPSMMTSLLPTATGVWHWSDMLREEYLTLAEVMRSQGYLTASFIQNLNAGSHAGLQQGFETIFDTVTIGERTDAILGDKVDDWLSANKHRNFFLNLHVIDPHGPYDPPAPYDRWYRDSTAESEPVDPEGEFEPTWLDTPTADSRRLLYDGEIANNDHLLRGFFERLEAQGLAENTLVVFVSDHGEYMGERGFWGHHPPGHPEVTGVPLMFVYPERFEGGVRLAQVAQIMDVMPTILEVAGVDTAPLALQGESLVDLMEGRRIEHWNDRIALSEEPMKMAEKGEPCGCGSIFYRDWHLLNSTTFLPGGSPVPQSAALRVYDFRGDRRELSTDKAFIADPWIRLRYDRVVNSVQTANTEAWRRWTGGVTETVRFDPAVQDRLKALGYIEE